MILGCLHSVIIVDPSFHNYCETSTIQTSTNKEKTVLGAADSKLPAARLLAENSEQGVLVITKMVI